VWHSITTTTKVTPSHTRYAATVSFRSMWFAVPRTRQRRDERWRHSHQLCNTMSTLQSIQLTVLADACAQQTACDRQPNSCGIWDKVEGTELLQHRDSRREKTQQVSKVIWQKAASPCCRSSRRRMHSSAAHSGRWTIRNVLMSRCRTLQYNTIQNEFITRRLVQAKNGIRAQTEQDSNQGLP